MHPTLLTEGNFLKQASSRTAPLFAKRGQVSVPTPQIGLAARGYVYELGEEKTTYVRYHLGGRCGQGSRHVVGYGTHTAAAYMTSYRATIGLEIHAELKTKSKMFCGCANDPEALEPNSNICPICMAHPGTLPVINRAAVAHVLRVGVAVGGTVADFSEFDRKNYFYPDIPKNYQISQYKYPLVAGGAIGPVAITRIHLEEDTARSSHGPDTSLVDFNRAGVPLMELVTEPVIHDAVTAVTFARELRLLLVYLGASDANLEKGEMRVEANVSIAPDMPGVPLGTKVEVKNLNSFRAVEQAIGYEIERQGALLDAGDRVKQETRGWDEHKQRTFSQRAKEESHDYRYFPDPDLPKLLLSEVPEWEMEALRRELPELPWSARERYVAEGLQPTIAAIIVGDIDVHNFYEAVCKKLTTRDFRVSAANYLVTDLIGAVHKQGYVGISLAELDAAAFSEIIIMVTEGTLSSRGAKDVLATWVQEGGSPRTLAERLGLVQVSDTDALRSVVVDIIKANEGVAAEYRGGKEAALQFLVGQAMKATKGAANPATLQSLFREEMKRT